jgi:FkbM family methyltransferase
MSVSILSKEARQDLKRTIGIPSMNVTLAALKARGISPKAAVDAGGFDGSWTTMFREIFPDTPVLIVEPQPRHSERLTKLCKELGPGVFFSQTLLGASAKNAVPFCILDDGIGGYGSSVMPEISNVPRHTEMLPMNTLKQLVADVSFPNPDFLKLDVQGYELEVLKGADSLLSGVEFILLEISTWQYNEGAPLLHDVLQWMADAGFVTFDLCEVHRFSDGTLCQLDLLFVRRTSWLLVNKKIIWKGWAPDTGYQS